MNLASFLSSLDSVGFTVLRILLSVLWQSTIILAAALALTWFLRRRGESVRHVIWTGAVCLIPLLPLLNWGAARLGSPRAEIQVFQPYTAHETVKIEDVSVNMPLSAPEQSSQDKIQSQTNIIPPHNAQISLLDYPWALGLAGYLLFVFAFLLWIAVGRLRIRRWILDGEAIIDPSVLDTFREAGLRLGFNREFPVIEYQTIPAPVTCRIFHPVIILPTGFAKDLSYSEIRAVSFHELTHISRHDTLIFTLVSLIRAVFFFQPLIWFAGRRISYLAELACDNAVLDSQADPASYAEFLTRIALQLPDRAFSKELAAGILFTNSCFFRRVREILSESRGQVKKLTGLALAGLILIGLVSIAASLALPLGSVGDVNTVEKKQKKEYWLEGSVVDSKGNPISGAHFYVQWNDPGPTHPPRVKGAKTDRQGRFLIEGIPLRIILEDFLRHKTYGNYQYPYLETNRSYTFVLQKPEGSVSGRVIDEKGKPVKGVDVSFDGPSIGPTGYSHTVIRTDRKGRFHLENLEEEVHTIRAGHRVFGQGIARNVPIKAENITIVLTKEWQTIVSDQLKAIAYLNSKKGIASQGKPAPEISISQWLTGTPHTLESLRGKVVMLFFWNCQVWDSVRPLALLDSWQQKYAVRGVECIAIHPYTTDLRTVRQVAKERAGSVTVAIDRESSLPEAQGDTFDRYGVLVKAENNLPKILIINRDGEVVYRGPTGFINSSYFDPSDIELGIEREIKPPSSVSIWGNIEKATNLTEKLLAINDSIGKAAPETNSKSITYSGKVFFDGKPVSGAEIYFQYQDINLIKSRSEKTAVSRPDGSFKFQGPEPKNGLCYVYSTFQGHLLGWQNINQKNERENIALTLYETGSIKGKVSDQSGLPVVGAEVIVKNLCYTKEGQFTNTFITGSLPGTSVVTDKSGTFILKNVPAITTCDLLVKSSGYAIQEKNKVNVGVEDVIFSLVPEGRIEGRVLYEDSGKPSKHLLLYVTGRYVRTDENGSFSVSNLKEAPYTIHRLNIPSEEDLVDWTMTPTKVLVESGKTSHIDVKMVKGAVITGKVMNKDTGLPVANVSLMIKTDMYLMVVPQKTDDLGVFRVRYPGGIATLSVSSEYDPASDSWYRVSPGTDTVTERLVDVRENETLSGINFSIDSQKGTKGAVISPEGNQGYWVGENTNNDSSTNKVNPLERYKKRCDVYIKSDSKIFINNNEIQIDNVVEAIKTEFKKNGNTGIKICSNPNTKVDVQTKVLEAAFLAGGGPVGTEVINK